MPKGEFIMATSKIENLMAEENFSNAVTYKFFAAELQHIVEGRTRTYDSLSLLCKIAVQESIFRQSHAPLTILLNQMRSTELYSITKILCAALCSPIIPDTRKNGEVHYLVPKENNLQFIRETSLYEIQDPKNVQEYFKANIKSLRLNGKNTGPNLMTAKRILHWQREKTEKLPLTEYEVLDLISGLKVRNGKFHLALIDFIKAYKN